MRDVEVAALMASSAWDSVSKACQEYDAATDDVRAALRLFLVIPSPYTEIVLHRAVAALERAQKALT